MSGNWNSVELALAWDLVFTRKICTMEEREKRRVLRAMTILRAFFFTPKQIPSLRAYLPFYFHVSFYFIVTIFTHTQFTRHKMHVLVTTEKPKHMPRFIWKNDDSFDGFVCMDFLFSVQQLNENKNKAKMWYAKLL